MEALIITIHVIACLILIVLVLLQTGKEDMGVIFGGGSSSMFGGSGAGSLLAKITAWVAAIFLVTSLGYNYMLGTRIDNGDSLMLEGDGIVTPVKNEEVQKPAVQFETNEPAQPAETPGASEAAPAAKPAGETSQAPAQTPAQTPSPANKPAGEAQ
ncbi:MAG: preprotein translocase subunit SecG [Desulfovibrionales bacterium]|nr:preprotein translocase subunit SecG [Desulfovibrionales bacterium]